MTDKQFVQSSYKSARCRWYADRKECLVVAYPNTLLFGTSTKSKSPILAWKKAAEILRAKFLRKLEQ